MLSRSWPSAWPPCPRPPSKRQNPWAPDSLRLPQSPGPCAHFLFLCPMYFAWNFADSLTVLQTVPGGHCLCFLRPVFAFGICCSLYLACCSPREPGKLPTIFSRGSPEVTACGGQCWGKCLSALSGRGSLPMLPSRASVTALISDNCGLFAWVPEFKGSYCVCLNLFLNVELAQRKCLIKKTC